MSHTANSVTMQRKPNCREKGTEMPGRWEEDKKEVRFASSSDSFAFLVPVKPAVQQFLFLASYNLCCILIISLFSWTNCLPTSMDALDILRSFLSCEILIHVRDQLSSTTSTFMLKMKDKALNSRHSNEKNLELWNKTIYKKSNVLATAL